MFDTYTDLRVSSSVIVNFNKEVLKKLPLITCAYVTRLTQTGHTDSIFMMVII